MKKLNRKKKPEALKQVFERIGKGNMKFPRKLRKAALREMDAEQEKFTKKVKTYASSLSKKSQFPNHFEKVLKLPAFKSRLIELFDQQMQPLPFKMPDTLGGKATAGTLSKLVFLEKAKIEIADTKEVKETIKSVEVKPDKLKAYQTELKESGGPTMDTSNFQGQVSVNQMGKFFPYPPNSFTRQMYVPDSWFMLARAAHCYNYNPMAKALIDIKTAFIIGTGPKVVIVNDALKTEWAKFEKDEDLSETFRTWCSMLSTNGELFTEFYVNPITSLPTVRSIDPGHVYDIITEPRDIRIVYGYKLMYQTAMQIFTDGAKGETVPSSEWIYETVAPDNIMHIKINIQENEKRGRSDLLCILAVLQLLEDYIRYKVLRTIVEAAFVWDVEMKGADQEQIDGFLQDEDQAFPRPGSTRAHNENVTWKSDGASGSAGNEDVVFEMLLTLIAVGGGLPKEYLGSSRGGTRATAITSSEPSVKGFQGRRHKIEVLIMRIVDFLAVNKNIQYEPDQVEVTWEEIAPENASEKMADLYTALDRNTFTKKYVDETVAKVMGRTNYDWNAEQKGRLAELTTDKVQQLLDGLTSPQLGLGPETPEPGQPIAKPAPATPASPQAGHTSMTNDQKKNIKKSGQQI